MDLTLNNLHWLIFHTTKPNQTKQTLINSVTPPTTLFLISSQWKAKLSSQTQYLITLYSHISFTYRKKNHLLSHRTYALNIFNWFSKVFETFTYVLVEGTVFHLDKPTIITYISVEVFTVSLVSITDIYWNISPELISYLARIRWKKWDAMTFHSLLYCQIF